MPGTTLTKPNQSSAQQSPENRQKKRAIGVNCSKWGYFFITPFFIAFAVFTMIPLVTTFYNSFLESYWVGLTHVGPRFVGFNNYVALFSDKDLYMYASNTAIIWIMGFIPQIVFSLLLAAWFTDIRLHLRATGFFKTVIYLPNLIMAAAFSMLFFTLFSDSGPVNNILMSMGMETPFRFLANTWSTRGLIALMNFLMWYGNTTILLMAAILGIDPSLFEAAEIDGATAFQSFKKITMPLIRPILVYVLITSLIGGLQMFDVPQILTNGNGNPNRSSMTLVMFLNKHLFSENVGMAGAVSVLLFVVAGALSVLVYFSIRDKKQPVKGGAEK